MPRPPTPLGAAAALVLLLAPSQANAVGVPAPMRVSVGLIPGGFRVCGTGDADAASHLWRFSIDGIRSTGGQISHTITGSAAKFDECVDILKTWSPAGTFVAVLDYIGTGPDLTGHFVGVGSWMSGPPDQHIGTGVD